jgi:hypothetical protein
MKSRQVCRFNSFLVCSLLAAGATGSSWAQSTSGAQGLLDNSWVFNLGTFAFETAIRASLNGQSRNNPEIDFDDTFGKANDATRVRADVLWRLTPTHHLRAMYFDNSTTRSRVLAEDVQWGDYTFGKGTGATLEQKLKVLALAYEYAFVRSPSYEVSGMLGVHYLDLSAQISGTATVTGPNCGKPPCTASAATQANQLPAPLPVVGFRWGWVVAPDWYIDAQGQYFKVKVGNYDGSWADARLSANWMFSRNVGLGLGYNRFTTRISVDKRDFDGRLKLGYSGVQVFLTGTF